MSKGLCFFVLFTGADLKAQGVTDAASHYFFSGVSYMFPKFSEPVGFLTGKARHFVIQCSEDELFGTHSVRTAVEVLRSKHAIAEWVIADGLSHYNAQTYVPYLEQSVPWLVDSTFKQNKSFAPTFTLSTKN